MAKIFITGSSDGLGLLAAKKLMQEGHDVLLHARNRERQKDLSRKNISIEKILIGDLSDINEIKALADKVNQQGKFDAIIHNAGVYNVSSTQIFTVNTLAPYILTCLIEKPKRLTYLSSGMNQQGRLKLDTVKADRNYISYADTKLHVIMLSMAVARRWPSVFSNAVNPGWVPTKMGGSGAPDNLQKGFETQTWLAVSNDEKAKVSGRFFLHQQERTYNPEADDVELQEKFLKRCQEITSVEFPG